MLLPQHRRNLFHRRVRLLLARRLRDNLVHRPPPIARARRVEARLRRRQRNIHRIIRIRQEPLPLRIQHAHHFIANAVDFHRFPHGEGIAKQILRRLAAQNGHPRARVQVILCQAIAAGKV